MEPFGRTRSTPLRAGSLEVDEGKVKVRSRTSMANSLPSEAPLDAISAEVYSMLFGASERGRREKRHHRAMRCDGSRASFIGDSAELRLPGCFQRNSTVKAAGADVAAHDPYAQVLHHMHCRTSRAYHIRPLQ